MAMPYHSQQKWASGNGAPDKVVYDQHFFSGQDCFVFLYPHVHKKLVPIPVTQLSYGISQQKVPIFGAWSYLFDTVARGQRIVQGEISIVYSYPNMLGQMLGDENQSANPAREEDGSIMQIIDRTKSMDAAKRKDLRAEYWGGTESHIYLNHGVNFSDENKPSFPFGHKAPSGRPDADYAGHPPFDIIVAYGNNPSMRFTDSSKFDYATWAFSTKEYMRMMSTTPNEAASGWESSHRLRIEWVELTSAGSMLEVSGQPLQETYAFFARDITSPKASMY